MLRAMFSGNHTCEEVSSSHLISTKFTVLIQTSDNLKLMLQVGWRFLPTQMDGYS